MGCLSLAAHHACAAEQRDSKTKTASHGRHSSLQVPPLGPLTALRRLELSYNGIKSLSQLTALATQNLSDLYVASNRISSVRLFGPPRSICVPFAQAHINFHTSAKHDQKTARGRCDSLATQLRQRCTRSPVHSAMADSAVNRPTVLNLKLLCTALQAEGIEHLSSLTLLELGSNRLKSLEPIAGLTRLRELWLGRNRLASLEGLSGCAVALVAGGFTACSAKSCAMLYAERVVTALAWCNIWIRGGRAVEHAVTKYLPQVLTESEPSRETGNPKKSQADQPAAAGAAEQQAGVDGGPCRLHRAAGAVPKPQRHHRPGGESLQKQFQQPLARPQSFVASLLVPRAVVCSVLGTARLVAMVALRLCGISLPQQGAPDDEVMSAGRLLSVQVRTNQNMVRNAVLCCAVRTGL